MNLSVQLKTQNLSAMKKILTITAMLLIAIGMNAQSNQNRSRTSTGTNEEKKAQSTNVESRSHSQSSKPAESARPETRTTRTQTQSAPAQNEPRRPAERTERSQPGEQRKVQSGNNTGNHGNSSYQARPTERSSGNVQQSRSRDTEVNRTGTSTTRTTTRTTTVNRENESRNGSYTPGGERRQATVNQGTSRTVPANRQNQSVRGGTDYDPKTGQVHVEKRRVYTTPGSTSRVVRTVPQTTYVYRPVEYRRVHYPYRTPPRVEIIWDYRMYNDYRYLYPEYNLWYYSYGYRIHTISAYDVRAYVGEVARVYGIIDEVWYDSRADEYYLYFGGPYPYQDFTVILDGHDARKFSRRPIRFFAGRHITVTGLVSMWEGKPEMVVKRRNQIDLY